MHGPSNCTKNKPKKMVCHIRLWPKWKKMSFSVSAEMKKKSFRSYPTDLRCCKVKLKFWSSASSLIELPSYLWVLILTLLLQLVPAQSIGSASARASLFFVLGLLSHYLASSSWVNFNRVTVLTVRSRWEGPSKTSKSTEIVAVEQN